MKAVLFCVVALFAIALAQPTPIRPKISETFEGEGYTHIQTVNESIWGLGRWAIDEPNGHAIELWEFSGEHVHHTVHFLKRYDLGFDYIITREGWPHPHLVCRKHAVKPPMPPAWAWTNEARYHGKHVIDESTFDLWRYHAGGVSLEVAVGEHDASRPHYYSLRTPSEHRMYHFISWYTFKPNATWFTVPDVCKNATEAIAGVEDINDAPGHDSHMATCAVAASTAARIATTSNGMTAINLIAQSHEGLNVPNTIAGLLENGAGCSGGAKAGDVFFDASSAAVYLGGNEFAECPIAGGACSIVGWRAFSGGCRRYC